MNHTLTTHPVLADARKFIAGLGASRWKQLSEAFRASAADGDATAETCAHTLEALLADLPTLDMDVLGLAWTIRDMEATALELARAESDDDDLSLLEQAVKDLLASEDSTGCTDDLTVVSKEAVEKLQQLLEGEA